MRIRRVTAGATGPVVRSDVARLLTTGTQVKVPPGILQPGAHYLLRITAVVSPPISIPTMPYRNAFPAHSSATMSGLLRVP